MAESNDIKGAAALIRHLADAGILDRCFQIKVGSVEVNLGPADLPSAVSSLSDSDPQKRIFMQLLGRGRELGNVG